MIIDQLNKFIFVHIPKSGGTSIHKLLENNNEFTISLWGKMAIKIMHVYQYLMFILCT